MVFNSVWWIFRLWMIRGAEENSEFMDKIQRSQLETYFVESDCKEMNCVERCVLGEKTKVRHCATSCGCDNLVPFCDIGNICSPIEGMPEGPGEMALDYLFFSLRGS